MKPARVASHASKTSPKNTTNVSLATAVYVEAKKFGINISQVCEQRLLEEIQARKEPLWNELHADFIATYNEQVAAEGVALQEWRSF